MMFGASALFDGCRAPAKLQFETNIAAAHKDMNK